MTGSYDNWNEWQLGQGVELCGCIIYKWSISSLHIHLKGLHVQISLFFVWREWSRSHKWTAVTIEITMFQRWCRSSHYTTVWFLHLHVQHTEYHTGNVVFKVFLSEARQGLLLSKSNVVLSTAHTLPLKWSRLHTDITQRWQMSLEREVWFILCCMPVSHPKNSSHFQRATSLYNV